MTDTEMTCEQFEERLAEYMEGDLHGAERTRMDAHLASCSACGALVADLRRIVTEAASLPPIEPPAAVWAGIETRIAAAVVPIATRRRTVPLVRAITAAAAMVLVTATLTYVVTARGNARAANNATGAETVAGRPTSAAITPTPIVDSGAGAQSSVSPNASYQTRGPESFPGSVRTVAHAERTSVRTDYAAAVYDNEIARLRSVLKRREDLDPKTVAAIQRSLAVIDTAITQARAAVTADPASAFLNKRLADAQNKKVELLRTAAMLPST